MKTLIVHYCPREGSNTKKLVDEFAKNIKGDLEFLDLTEDVPDLLLKPQLNAYVKAYYQDSPDAETDRVLRKMQDMAQQLKSADVVVLAYPLYNFSLPATVKAWFDSVILKNETFEIKKGFRGLMHGKKALIISTSGGTYEGDNSRLDFSTGLAKAEFEFMGYDEVQLIFAQGMNSSKTPENTLDFAKQELKRIASSWYE